MEIDFENVHHTKGSHVQMNDERVAEIAMKMVTNFCNDGCSLVGQAESSVLRWCSMF